MNMGVPELLLLVLVFLLVLAPVGAILALCYVWMTRSRASQTRTEDAGREMVTLLREQNDLLRRIADRN